MTTTLKLGKRPARPGAVKIKLANYLDKAVLTAPTGDFGHDGLVTDWQMLGNDTVGDCAICGPLHAIMLWNAEANKTVNVDTDCAIANYSAITGYDPSQDQTNPDGTVSNPTDQGTDVAEMAEYWRQTGFADADGNRHQIGAYVALTPGDLTELWVALKYFDGVGIGVQFPEQWMDAFRTGQPWGTLAQPNIQGGHYICGVGRKDGNATVISWGKPVELTVGGYQQFNDETLALISTEKLVNGVDLEGLNWAQLQADIQQLNTGTAQ